MPIRNSVIAGLFCRFLERSVLPKLTQQFTHPDQFSFLGLGLAVLVPLGFYFHPLPGLLLMILSGVSDTLDGIMARSQGKASNFGAFLDSSLDRVSDFCYIFGFWVLFWNSEKIILASAIVFFALLVTHLISYLKARAMNLGICCETGLMERGLRTVYLIVWATLLVLFPFAFETILWTGLILFCLLCLFTVFQRALHAAHGLK
jgi:phosphatidylglycerophosphate synthase